LTFSAGEAERDTKKTEEGITEKEKKEKASLQNTTKPRGVGAHCKRSTRQKRKGKK